MPISLSEISTYLEQHSVANYSALPAANTVPNELWYCISKQGTAWLPGSWGGTYYSNGWYFSDGTNWSYQETAFEASLIEVNAGTITDKWVSPNTLANSNWAFTTAKVLATVLSGLSVASGGTILATDTILQALGKLQYQLNNIDLSSKVSKSGDTMTGDLILNADPTLPLGAVTKQYADNNGGGAASKLFYYYNFS